MDKPKYYTDAEMLEKLEMLHLKGKPLTNICRNPRCQPEMKDKLEALDSLQLKWDQLTQDFNKKYN